MERWRRRGAWREYASGTKQRTDIEIAIGAFVEICSWTRTTYATYGEGKESKTAGGIALTEAEARAIIGCGGWERVE